MSASADESIIRGAEAWYPQLLTRAWPKEEIEAAFDAWQVVPHQRDLATGPGVVMCMYYKVVLDGVAQAYKGAGTSLAIYTARTVDGLFEWMNSAVLAAAVADGSQWFGKFNDVDGYVFTGNIYEVVGVEGSPEVPADAALFIERFEVDEESCEAFDTWARAHTTALASCTGVFRSRFFHQSPRKSPVAYYQSVGNRMVASELDSSSLHDTLMSKDGLAILEDSMCWDRRLEYVRREVYAHVSCTRAKSAGVPPQQTSVTFDR